MGDSGPTPAIALTLMTDDTLQTATVTVATPADSILPGEGVPVSSADVSLRIVDEDGTAWPLTTTAIPGRFEVIMAPAHGRRYELRGTVLGHPVGFATVIPERFDLVSLPRDTIGPADAIPCSYAGNALCFLVVTDSDQLLTVLCSVAPESSPFACSVDDQAQLRVPASPGVHDVFVVGYTGEALQPRLAATVTRFGSAVVVRRTAVIP